LGVEPVLLFVFLFAQNLYKAIINTNWLLAIASDRIWIKYRSYLNCHLPADDLQIIEFPFSEIESVCLVDRKEIVPNNRNAKQQQLFWFFEFTLYQPIDERLPNALRSERQLKDSQNRIIRYKNDDYPVRVSGDYSFRVRVNELRPRWKKALRELEHNGVTIAPEKREIEDYTVLLEDKRQMEDQLIVLVEQGKTIAAVKLACRRYGMTLTEAKNFIDGLSSR
jgi:hypothetical protein